MYLNEEAIEIAGRQAENLGEMAIINDGDFRIKVKKASSGNGYLWMIFCHKENLGSGMSVSLAKAKLDAASRLVNHPYHRSLMM